MRKGPRDVANERQRALFGVDCLERHVADLTVELLRFVRDRDGVTHSVSRETTHVKRLKSWLELYQELQRSDFELDAGEADTEVRDGAEKE